MHHLAENKDSVERHFFSNEEYGKILDSIVITCVDIILICGQEVLMVKRNVYPRKDWWVVGGRMFPGESPQETAGRKLKEEVGLEVLNNRFGFLNTYSTVFTKRQQESQGHGSHTVNLLFTIKILPKEKELISLLKKEYSDFKWVDINDLIDHIDSDDIFLNTIYNDLKHVNI